MHPPYRCLQVLNEHKSQELDTLKSEAIALGSKHEALEAEYTIKSEEVKQWSEERARLESANGQLEGSLNGVRLTPLLLLFPGGGGVW